MKAIAVIRLFGDYFVSARADVNDWRTSVAGFRLEPTGLQENLPVRVFDSDVSTCGRPPETFRCGVDVTQGTVGCIAVLS